MNQTIWTGEEVMLYRLKNSSDTTSSLENGLKELLGPTVISIACGATASWLANTTLSVAYDID